jgi:hypothetical protein
MGKIYRTPSAKVLQSGKNILDCFWGALTNSEPEWPTQMDTDKRKGRHEFHEFTDGNGAG